MILVLKQGISEEEKRAIKTVLKEAGNIIREIQENGRHVLGAIGRPGQDIAVFEHLNGVEKVIPIKTAFKLASREMQNKDTVVPVGPVAVVGDRITVVAGPCAVESRQQAMTIAREVRKYGAVLFRAGAFKPRTSPYSFQGMGEEGLKILADVREEFGMGVVTEITSPTQADVMMKYIDVIQVGARNMQNFELLKCVGRMGKPVLLKRGLSATIEEWLMSAEYILSEGNPHIILCERGIRTFEPYTRNTLDLSAIPVLKKLTHLPILVDPSHATGLREKVSPMARAAIAAGADGLLIEVHHDPDNALSDGPQSLYPKQFGQLMRNIYVIAPVIEKQLDFSYIDKARATQNTPRPDGSNGKKRAAFLGRMGTFSHKACAQFFGDTVEALPISSFRGIFESVSTGAAEYGVLPLENSLTGSIHENYDLLIEFDLKIVGEITLRIMHHLIAHPGTSLDDIRCVMSHPQVLEQCRQFLDSHPDWELVSVKDTAMAVKSIKDSGDKRMAAIANKVAAEVYQMEVIEEGIETDPRNFTRFVVIGKTPLQNAQRNKSSIVYSTGNQPGALFETLKIFSENGINLVKLESRPIHGKPWEYMFYVDIETDVTADAFQPILSSISEKTDYLKVLGSY